MGAGGAGVAVGTSVSTTVLVIVVATPSVVDKVKRSVGFTKTVGVGVYQETSTMVEAATISGVAVGVKVLRTNPRLVRPCFAASSTCCSTDDCGRLSAMRAHSVIKKEDCKNLMTTTRQINGIVNSVKSRGAHGHILKCL